MGFTIKHKAIDEAELDITSFMNLMIVLVPVLLLSMTFTQITVHEISLPELTGGASTSEKADSRLEVAIRKNGFEVYYPSGTLIKRISLLQVGSAALAQTPAGAGTAVKTLPANAVAPGSGSLVYDFRMLSLVMQEMKLTLPEKRDLLISLSPDVNYQTLVSTMDAVKSYKTVIVASLVEVELFPEISLGDRS